MGQLCHPQRFHHLYDAAYEAFIRDENIPHSIYEIRGARKVAIEFHSYSKTAGFTGVRCGYTVVPKELTAATMDGNRLPLNPFWLRRQSTKFNGTSYISQRAAEAIYTPEGKRQTQATINYYMENARIMHEALSQLGFKVYGGTDAPYLWVKTPGNTPPGSSSRNCSMERRSFARRAWASVHRARALCDSPALAIVPTA